MLFTASYSNLETLVPGIDTNPADINPGGPSPTSFTDEPWNGGTTVSIDGPQWAAGLSKRSVPLPTNVAFTKFTLAYQINPSENAAIYSQAHETDLMLSGPLGTVFNGSMRKNNQTGGMWEIPNAAGTWVATGFQPALFAPSAWTPVSASFLVNWTAGTLSVTNITDGTQTFAVPVSLQNVPAFKLAWQPNLLVLQLQETLLATGSYSRDVRNIGIVMQ